MEFSLIETIVLYAVPLVFAITLHEAAHGYVARMLGDPTAERLGRITLNPLKHIDPVGTIAVPLGIYLLAKLTGIAIPPFGWAKPVPVDFRNLRQPKRDMFWVAIAGPGANFLMAIFWILFGKLFGATSEMLLVMSKVGVFSNLFLMVLNLLPILPLDGGRIAVSLLPNALAVRYAQLEPFGMLIIIVFIVTGSSLLWPMVKALHNFIGIFFGPY